jgi:hypothetical protein
MISPLAICCDVRAVGAFLRKPRKRNRRATFMDMSAVKGLRHRLSMVTWVQLATFSITRAGSFVGWLSTLAIGRQAAKSVYRLPPWFSGLIFRKASPRSKQIISVRVGSSRLRVPKIIQCRRVTAAQISQLFLIRCRPCVEVASLCWRRTARKCAVRDSLGNKEPNMLTNTRWTKQRGRRVRHSCPGRLPGGGNERRFRRAENQTDQLG